MLQLIIRRVRALAHQIRHHKFLRRADRLWAALKPIYEKAFDVAFQRGIAVQINSDTIRLLPRFCSVESAYEPDVYRHILSEIRSGDRIVEVGGHIGLYTIPMARKVGATGNVMVFEPDAGNASALHSHLHLNGVSDRVALMRMAVSDNVGPLYFTTAGFASSHILESSTPNAQTIAGTTLDAVLGNQRVDILKIDVEGFEERVLRGGIELFKDQRRCPRAIYIEVHPQFWARSGTTSESLLGLLKEFEYRVVSLDGALVESVKEYGEILAVKAAR